MRHLWTLMVVGAGIALSPAGAWAVCGYDSPMFSSASSQSVSTTTTVFSIVARDKEAGCALEGLSMSVAGLPATPGLTVTKTAGAGEASATITVNPGSFGVATTFYATYTATDARGLSTSVTLPLYVKQPANRSPSLDPISDLLIAGTTSFTIGVTDLDADLSTTSPETLVVNGLPTGTMVSSTPATGTRKASTFTVTPTTSNRGVWRVHIQGKDTRGGVTIAQMRIHIP